MTGADRLRERVDRAARSPERLLVLYLTLGDPLTSDPEILRAAVAAGADALELGFPTPTAEPRGEEIRLSFARASQSPVDPWQTFAALRELAPDVLILPLVYPATVRDLGLPALLDGAAGAGTDGVVLVEPRADELRAVTAAGLGAIPVIRPSATPEEVAALEACAPHLTYRTLAAGTGATLDIDDARRAARAMQATAQRPFMVGFGIRRDTEIRALAPHVTGIVIGSELIRLLRDLPAPERVSFMTRTVAAWKAAATLP